jgi:ParB-like chromosome segregation protein Spo0J
MPVVVVAGGQVDRYVLVDGYKRVRALRRLGQAGRRIGWGSTVTAGKW